MKCPGCPDTTLVMSDRQGVEIDYCPACRGIWLDRGELDKLLDRAASVSAPAAVVVPASGPEPTHRVSALWGYGFKNPDIKRPLRMVLPLGSRVMGTLEGDFLQLNSGLFMPRQHVAPAATSLASAGISEKSAHCDMARTVARRDGYPQRYGVTVVAVLYAVRVGFG